MHVSRRRGTRPASTRSAHGCVSHAGLAPTPTPAPGHRRPSCASQVVGCGLGSCASQVVGCGLGGGSSGGSWVVDAWRERPRAQTRCLRGRFSAHCPFHARTSPQRQPAAPSLVPRHSTRHPCAMPGCSPHPGRPACVPPFLLRCPPQPAEDGARHRNGPQRPGGALRAVGVAQRACEPATQFPSPSCLHPAVQTSKAAAAIALFCHGQPLEPTPLFCLIMKMRSLGTRATRAGRFT